MESTIEVLEMILRELKSWEHEPRPATVEVLKAKASEMYNAIFG